MGRHLASKGRRSPLRSIRELGERDRLDSPVTATSRAPSFSAPSIGSPPIEFADHRCARRSSASGRRAWRSSWATHDHRRDIRYLDRSMSRTTCSRGGCPRDESPSAHPPCVNDHLPPPSSHSPVPLHVRHQIVPALELSRIFAVMPAVPRGRRLSSLRCGRGADAHDSSRVVSW